MRALILLCLIAGAFATPSGTAPCNARPGECPKTPLPHSTSRLVKKTRPADDFVIISTPLLRLGVYGPGSLDAYPTDFPSANTDPANGNPVGLRYLGGVENDATAPGCLCEGFGVSAVFDDGHSESAVADQSTGFAAISYGAPTAVGTTGADAFAVALTAPHTLGIKHEFRLSSVTNNAFQVNITITNQHTSSSITRLRYERQMDWDIYPTTFAECVDIDIGTAQDLPCAHDNGFVDGNPDTNFPDPSGAYINLGSCGGSFPRQLFNSGPADHGAAFLIQFHDINSTHPLGPGESKSFLMFYGAAGNKAAAQAVLGLLNVEAYSLGYPSAATDGGARTCDPSINFGAPNTYLWAFAGIGGEVVNPGGCSGTDCAVTTACPTASSASASTTTSNCASIGFAASAC